MTLGRTPGPDGPTQHGEVLGAHHDGSSVDGSRAGDDPVGRCRTAGGSPGADQSADLPERAGVQQVVDPGPGVESVTGTLRPVPLQAVGATHGSSVRPSTLQVFKQGVPGVGVGGHRPSLTQGGPERERRPSLHRRNRPGATSDQSQATK